MNATTPDVAAIVAACNAGDGPRLTADASIDDLLVWLRWDERGPLECDRDPEAYPEGTAELWTEIAMHVL